MVLDEPPKNRGSLPTRKMSCRHEHLHCWQDCLQQLPLAADCAAKDILHVKERVSEDYGMDTLDEGFKTPGFYLSHLNLATRKRCKQAIELLDILWFRHQGCKKLIGGCICCDSLCASRITSGSLNLKS